jgi:CBS domain-containing protein
MSTIRQVMEPEPITVRPESTIREALEILIENKISGLPVVDADRVILGILSEKDLLRVFYEPHARTVGSVMTPAPTRIAVDAPLVDVFDCLMAEDFRRVLIHEDGKLVGLISRADLMPVILDALVERAG